MYYLKQSLLWRFTKGAIQLQTSRTKYLNLLVLLSISGRLTSKTLSFLLNWIISGQNFAMEIVFCSSLITIIDGSTKCSQLLQQRWTQGERKLEIRKPEAVVFLVSKGEFCVLWLVMFLHFFHLSKDVWECCEWCTLWACMNRLSYLYISTQVPPYYCYCYCLRIRFKLWNCYPAIGRCLLCDCTMVSDNFFKLNDEKCYIILFRGMSTETIAKREAQKLWQVSMKSCWE